jgi:hypothetical protein
MFFTSAKGIGLRSFSDKGLLDHRDPSHTNRATKGSVESDTRSERCSLGVMNTQAAASKRNCNQCCSIKPRAREHACT